MTDFWDVLNLLTAAAWLGLAAAGIVLRTRRLLRLRDIVVISEDDRAYLASVKRCTYLRLSVKGVLLLGALVALFNWPLAFWAWRMGLIVVLLLMIWETLSVDTIRDRLGRHKHEGVTS